MLRRPILLIPKTTHPTEASMDHSGQTKMVFLGAAPQMPSVALSAPPGVVVPGLCSVECAHTAVSQGKEKTGKYQESMSEDKR